MEVRTTMIKKLFIILIILVMALNANAIVIEDLNKSISQNTQELARSNAELTAKISRLETKLTDLQNAIEKLNAEAMLKTDLPALYGNISQLNHEANAQNLATMLAVILFAFALLFLFKGKAWL